MTVDISRSRTYILIIHQRFHRLLPFRLLSPRRERQIVHHSAHRFTSSTPSGETHFIFSATTPTGDTLNPVTCSTVISVKTRAPLLLRRLPPAAKQYIPIFRHCYGYRISSPAPDYPPRPTATGAPTSAPQIPETSFLSVCRPCKVPSVHHPTSLSRT